MDARHSLFKDVLLAVAAMCLVAWVIETLPFVLLAFAIWWVIKKVVARN